jgi:hypothetical protein
VDLQGKKRGMRQFFFDCCTGEIKYIQNGYLLLEQQALHFAASQQTKAV